MLLFVDGDPVEYELGSERAGWVEVFRMGETVSGRRARVARYSVPLDLFRHGGTVRTSGHVFRLTRQGKTA